MPKTGLHDYGKLVEIPLQRRLVNLLSGMHQGDRAGTSHEFLDMAEYKAGDDVTDIDWKTSARHNQAIVKRFESTAIMTVYLMVDTGSNMAAATSVRDQRKRDVAAEFATAVSWLTAMRGDNLGLIVGNAEELRTVPARSGIAHSQKIVSISESSRVSSPPPAVPRLLQRVKFGAPQRSLLILITDHFQMTPEVMETLRRLQARHRVLVQLIDDYDPTAAGPEGPVLHATDIEAGPLPDFVTGDSAIASEWGNAVRAVREETWAGLSRLRIPFAVAGSREDVLPSLLRLFERGSGRG